MKKRIIAVSIATAFVAPAAFADVEIGPFAIYGTLNSAVELISVNANGAALANTAASQSRLADQSSKLGFKAKFDLGEGLFALGQIESRLYLGNNGDASDNKAELGSRNTFVGLGNNTLGTLRLGRYDNAYKNSTKQMGGTFRSTLNDASDDTGDKQIMTRLGSRQGDLISYESANWNGFTFNASYNLGKDSTNSISGGSANNTAKNTVATDLMPQYGLGLGYKVGNFSVGMGTTAVKNASWQLDTSSKANAANNKGSQNLKAWQIGAEYRFGEYSVGVITERTSSSLRGGVASDFDQAQTSTGIVGGYKSGPLDVQIRFSNAKDVTGTAKGLAVASDTGANQLGLVMGYKVHKNVQLIASYTRVDNKKNAAYTSLSGFTLAKGVDMNQIALGVAVSF